MNLGANCDIKEHHTQLNVCRFTELLKPQGASESPGQLVRVPVPGPFRDSNAGALGWAGDTGRGATEKSPSDSYQEKTCLSAAEYSQLKTSGSWHLQDPPSFLSHNQCSFVGV